MDALVTANPGTKTLGFIDVIGNKTFLIVSGVSALLLIMLVVMICVVQRRRRRHTVGVMSSNCTLQILNEPPGQIKVFPGSSLKLYYTVTCQEAKVACFFSASSSEGAIIERNFTCIDESSEMRCNYTLINVQVKDSGWYYCKFSIERPTLLQEESGKTRVDVAGNEMEVTANPVTRTPGIEDGIQSKTFLIVSGVSALLLIMLVVMICVVQRRRRRHKEMTCPIYGNTRPPPGASRKQTSEPAPLVASGVPPEALTPLKAKCRDVPEQDTSP
ncbi:uncharacterized protein LOC115555998 isoform X2 [Gadus morhua]|uniref:uncharacterized protein LOC115555998 isoform X2 n=1 Tax=Gadus morhua TaxID=8049 RepID=UPI0011B5233A|nr:uncharacterized protein LOC115555998 isoform X2 [Gadus morhua]